MNSQLTEPFYNHCTWYFNIGVQTISRVILETEGTVFPDADRPRPANNVLIFFYGIAVKGTKMAVR